MKPRKQRVLAGGIFLLALALAVSVGAGSPVTDRQESIADQDPAVGPAVNITGVTTTDTGALGQSLTITVTVENTGNQSSQEEIAVDLQNDLNSVASTTVEDVSLDSGESKAVTVTLSTNDFAGNTATLTVSTTADSETRTLSTSTDRKTQTVANEIAVIGEPYWPTEGYDGRNTGHNPTTAAPTANQEIDWQAGISAGTTQSSAVVVGNNIYYSHATSAATGTEFYKVHADTGERVWEYEIPRFGGGSVVDTPTVANGQVYFGDTDGKMYVLNESTGNLTTKIDVSEGIAADYATEPTIVNGTLYFGDHNGKIYAYDTKPTSQKWSFNPAPNASHSVTGAPVVVNGTVYYTTDSTFGYGVVYAVDAESGQERWNRSFSDDTSVNSFPKPAFYNGTLFVGDTRTSRLNALDPETGETRWSVSLTGEMAAQPAIDGDHLYVGDTFNTVTAVDLTTKSIDWQQGVGGKVLAAPSVANGIVYVGDDSGQVHALNASSGARMWSELLDGRILGTPTPANGSVYVTGKYWVYSISGSTEHGIVAALDPTKRQVSLNETESMDITAANTNDGVESFQATLELGESELANVTGVEFAGTPSSSDVTINNETGTVDISVSGLSIDNAEPTLATVSFEGKLPGSTGVELSITAMESASRSYDVIETRDATLNVLDDAGNWRMERYDERNTGHSPDAVSPTAFGERAWEFDIRVDHDPDEEKEEGSRTIGHSYVTVVDDVAFFGDRVGGFDISYLYAVNATTGEYLWRYNAGLYAIESTPAVANGIVYFGDTDGNLEAVNAEDGTPLWDVNLGSGTASDQAFTQTVIGNTLYVGNDDGKLFAFDATDGSQKWVHEASLGRNAKHAPVVFNGTVYYTVDGNGIGQVNAVDVSSGDGLWNRTFENATSIYRVTTPTAGDDAIYVSDSRATRLNALDPQSGETMWSVSTNGEIRGPPAVANGTIYIGDKAGWLYAVDEQTRTKTWERQIGSTFQSGPTVVNGAVYAGDSNGELHVVEAATGKRLWSEQLDGRILTSPTPTDGRVFVGGKHYVYSFGGLSDAWEITRTVTGTATDDTTVAGDTIDASVTANISEVPADGDLKLVEQFSENLSSVSITGVSVNGNDISTANQTTTSEGINVTIDRSEIQNDDTVTVTYTAQVPNDMPTGQTVKINGSVRFNGSIQYVGTDRYDVATAVNATLTLPDQDSVQGANLTVEDTTYTNDPFVIVLYDEAGQPVGNSTTFDAGTSLAEQEVTLDESLEGDQTVTAQLHHAADEAPYGDPIEIYGETVTDTAAITIVEEAAFFEVSNIDANDTEVIGETLTVNATVTNVGGAMDKQDIEVRLGDQFDSPNATAEDVTLDSGESTTRTFELEITQEVYPGDRETQLNVSTEDETASQIVVLLEETNSEFFVATDVSFDQPVEAGETLAVGATIRNYGFASGESQVRFILKDATLNNSEAVYKQLSLDAGESTTLDITLNTTGFDPGEGTLAVGLDTGEGETLVRGVQINEPVIAPDFEITGVDAADSVGTNENLSVNATVTNTGELAGKQNVEIDLESDISGYDIETVENVNLGVGESKTLSVSLNTSEFEAADASLGVQTDNDTATQTVTVFDPDDVNFAISNLEVSNANFSSNDGSTAVTGEDSIQVAATVENTASSVASETITVQLNSQTQASKTVQIDAENSTTVSFVFEAPAISADSYTISMQAGPASVSGSIELLPSVAVSGSPARDTTGDGLLNDINGDEQFNIFDVQALFEGVGSQELTDNAKYFDFATSDPPEVDIFDVQALFELVSS